MDPEVDGAPPLPRSAPAWPERLLFWAAGAGTVALGLLVTSAILLRWLADTSIPDSVLLVQQLMVAVIILPLAYVTAERGHIAVSIFTRWAGPRTALVLAILGDLAGLAFVAVLAAAAWPPLADALSTGAYHDGDLGLPKWIGRAVFFGGLAVFALRLAWLAGRDAAALGRRHEAPER